MINHSTIKPGDVVRNLMSGNAYTVVWRGTSTVVLAKFISLENPAEWQLVPPDSLGPQQEWPNSAQNTP